MQSTLKLSFLLSPNCAKINPEFVPKITTLLGYLFFFYNGGISYWRSNIYIAFQKVGSNRINLWKI